MEVENQRSRCKAWIEQQFEQHHRLLVYQIIAEATRRFGLLESVVMAIIAKVLREGRVV